MKRSPRTLGLLISLLAACGDPSPQEVPAASNIKHLVVVIQENHTFDNYFGRYCKAAAGSAPRCNAGPACCEAAPDQDPGSGSAPVVLNDKANTTDNPDHGQDCEVDEIDGGKMDRFVTSAKCGKPGNFAIADPATVMPYWQLAGSYALADRYFQPIAGASSSNDMYFARAGYVFTDNLFVPRSGITRCSLSIANQKEYADPTIGDLLAKGGVPWAFYAEGYQAVQDAIKEDRCPDVPPECSLSVPIYPCVYDASDVPFQYYPTLRDNPAYMRDLARLTEDLAAGTLPAVSFVKAIGYKTEHPGGNTNIKDGAAFVTALVGQLLASRYAQGTLVLVTYDEGGGFFNHVAPPPASSADGKPYGTRVPMLAIGSFSRKNHVSHVTMEHSSVVKFIEWNWLGRKTGQLGQRDGAVNNLGSLLDPAATGVAVPEQ